MNWMYESLKPLGVLSIALCWLSLLLLLVKWRGDKSMSLSQYAAAHPKSYVTMAILESIFLPMYFVFIATWFSYTFHLPPIFVVLNAITVIGLLIAAWIPHTGGKKAKIHTIAAYPAYVSMMLITLLIAFSDSISTPARVFGFAAFAYMLVSSYLLVKHELGRANFLYLQVAFLVIMDITILLATYVR
jgi:hypothetical protein